MTLHVFNILNAHLLFPHIFVYFVCVSFFFYSLSKSASGRDSGATPGTKRRIDLFAFFKDRRLLGFFVKLKCAHTFLSLSLPLSPWCRVRIKPLHWNDLLRNVTDRYNKSLFLYFHVYDPMEDFIQIHSMWLWNISLTSLILWSPSVGHVDFDHSSAFVLSRRIFAWSERTVVKSCKSRAFLVELNTGLFTLCKLPSCQNQSDAKYESRVVGSWANRRLDADTTCLEDRYVENDMLLGAFGAEYLRRPFGVWNSIKKEPQSGKALRWTTQ